MWDVFFSKLLGRGLIEVLPALLASIFVAYKSFHTIEEPKDEETMDGEYATKQFRERSKTKKRRILHLFLFLVIFPAAFASISVFIKGFVGVNSNFVSADFGKISFSSFRKLRFGRFQKTLLS